jgi:hypothetical protein
MFKHLKVCRHFVRKGPSVRMNGVPYTVVVATWEFYFGKDWERMAREHSDPDAVRELRAFYESKPGRDVYESDKKAERQMLDEMGAFNPTRYVAENEDL